MKSIVMFLQSKFLEILIVPMAVCFIEKQSIVFIAITDEISYSKKFYLNVYCDLRYYKFYEGPYAFTKMGK